MEKDEKIGQLSMKNANLVKLQKFRIEAEKMSKTVEKLTAKVLKYEKDEEKRK